MAITTSSSIRVKPDRSWGDRDRENFATALTGRKVFVRTGIASESLPNISGFLSRPPVRRVSLGGDCTCMMLDAFAGMHAMQDESGVSVVRGWCFFNSFSRGGCGESCLNFELASRLRSRVLSDEESQECCTGGGSGDRGEPRGEQRKRGKPGETKGAFEGAW